MPSLREAERRGWVCISEVDTGDHLRTVGLITGTSSEDQWWWRPISCIQVLVGRKQTLPGVSIYRILSTYRSALLDLHVGMHNLEATMSEHVCAAIRAQSNDALHLTLAHPQGTGHHAELYDCCGIWTLCPKQCYIHSDLPPSNLSG